MGTMTYREAVVLAQREALARDPAVMIMGEDIGAPGGPFKTTEGLFEEFGPDRVRDTPISENAFVGAALGMAVTGGRPIVEIMFADFMGVCFDQIVNSIAKHRFMCGGKVAAPLAIRAMGGGGVRFGAQHSQTGESWMYQHPGLKVYCPATPADAYELLSAAIADIDPVIVLEHKALMATKGEVETPADPAAVAIGPQVLREGKDVTLVGSLAMVRRCLDAAEQLAGQGIEAEVINLRVLRPLEPAAIFDSVRKTGRLVTVEEAHPAGGWSGDIIADTMVHAFDFIDAPPVRLTLPDWPMPYSPALEDAALPSVERIVAAVTDGH
ncbi:MAG: alpha-ketoacid dehydrogenase subunit beta [Gammaproteobacteria bacterium]|nr:alpha-ketoacid dehydrogenase subunit beta [Gammaproteobacteria bacterium]